MRQSKASASEGWAEVRPAGRLIIPTVTAAMLLSGLAATVAADEAKDRKADKPVLVEIIEDASVKRVTLTENAAQRLGIKTGEVREEAVSRKKTAGGLVVPPPGAAPLPGLAPVPTPPSASMNAGTSTMAPAVAPSGARRAPKTPIHAAPSPKYDAWAWVRVILSEGELRRVAQDGPAQVVPLSANNGTGGSILAQPSRLEPMTDVKRANVAVHYVVKGADHGLQPGQRVLVELPVAGSSERLKTVPYGAVIYDDKGASWVYTSPAPLVFVRERIDIRDIEGDQAALSSGPAEGTTIVTVGAMLLYGAEKIGK